MEEMIQIINQVGFPVGMCVYFAWDRVTNMKSFIASNNAQAQSNRELTAAIREMNNKRVAI